MKTIKECANIENVTYEAIRKQIQRYKAELAGHIFIENRTKYLDRYAQQFLHEKRTKSTIIIQQTNKDNELEQLKNENKALLIEMNKVRYENTELLKEKNILSIQNEKMRIIETLNEEKTNILNFQKKEIEYFQNVLEKQKNELERSITFKEWLRTRGKK